MTAAHEAPAPDARGTTPARGTTRPRIVLVAAVADNGVIGRDGAMPWHLPEDLRHFREVTTGHTVVMGRVTYESIGRPLPNRTNVVITRDPEWAAGRPEGVVVARSLEEALASTGAEQVIVMGGAQVYEAAMPLADVQILTEVHQSPEGDTFYPAFDRAEWRETRREPHDGYDFVWLERR